MKIIEPKQSAVALEITRKRYLMTDSRGRVVETVGEMLWRVAKHITKFEEDKKITEAFYERMVTKKFVCSGKAMFEAGNPGGNWPVGGLFCIAD